MSCKNTNNEIPAVREQIALNLFHSADALKQKIRVTTKSYNARGWKLISICYCEKFINLEFKPDKL